MNTIKKQRQFSKAILLFLICLLALSFDSLAAGQLWDEYVVPSSRQKERLLDDADLLTDSEEASLLALLDSYSEKWKCDIVVLTTDYHTGPIEAYADDYFDYNGFGAEFNKDGILLMLSMDEREWDISESGRLQDVINDSGRAYLEDNVLGYLGDDEYYDAFVSYAKTCDELLQMYADGTPYGVEVKKPKTASDVVTYIIISIVGGMLIALIPILVMKSDLKTVRMQANAASYESSKGISLRLKEDRFVRKTLHKTPIPKDTGSRSSGGGGSSSHTSSSGHSHSGSHGHF